MGACTRILLFVFTFLLLVGSALLIAGGVVLYINEKNYNFPTASALGVSFSLSNILQAVMGIGSYIALTSLFGCCGALTRKGGLLKGFIVLLVIDIIVIAGGGGYLLYKMVQNNNGINQLTYDNYYSYGNGTWLVFQSAFTCCGYKKGDTNTTFLDGLTNTTGATQNVTFSGTTYDLSFNPCHTTADLSTQPGCFDQAQAFINKSFKAYVIGFSVTIVFSIFLVVLAKMSINQHKDY